MAVGINGIEQLPEEGRKALADILKWSRVAFWVAIVSLIVAIIAIIVAVVSV